MVNPNQGPRYKKARAEDQCVCATEFFGTGESVAAAAAAAARSKMRRGLLHTPHRGVLGTKSQRWSQVAPWQHQRSRSSSACSTAMLDSMVTAPAEPRSSVALAPTLPCPILDQAPVHPDGLSSHEVLTSAAAQMAANSSTFTQTVFDEATTPAPYVPAFKQGDVVYATVVHTGFKGATAEIMYHQGLVGFMPEHQAPITPDQWASAHGRGRRGQWSEAGDRLHAHGVPLPEKSTLMKGHTRPFKVQSIPADMKPGVKGPLLSAYRYDQDMLWSRAAQLHQLAKEDADFTMSVKVTGYDSRHLTASFCGLQATIPRDYVLLRPKLNWIQAAEQLVGQELEVCLLTDRFNAVSGTIVLSESMAAWKRLTKPGTVLSGTIRMFTPYGAFVRVDGLGCQALLHNSRVTSDEDVYRAQEVFCMDERITFAMIGTAEDDQSRLAISTRALEHEHGEISTAKQYVFARAEEGPSVIRLPGEGRYQRNFESAERPVGDAAGQQGQRQLLEMLTRTVRTYGNHVETSASRAAEKQRAGKEAGHQYAGGRRPFRNQRSNDWAPHAAAGAVASEAQSAAAADHRPEPSPSVELAAPSRIPAREAPLLDLQAVGQCQEEQPVNQIQHEHAMAAAPAGSRRSQASYWQQWLD